ncbi:MAG: phosphatidylserine decarboxylase [Candidatus Omnitrophica bacterium]|nr:phosphatidylserine decarboxylase [Candidatus Omnitrophota bacterium]
MLIDRRAFNGSIPLVVLAVLGALVFKPLFGAAALLFTGHLAFFRDPVRRVPPGETVLSPADGLIVDMSEEDETCRLGQKAFKIGIFLSIFNCHISRAPIAGKVDYLKYEPGEFLNALNGESAVRNEANWVGIQGSEGRKAMVKQISGAIARRIHCDASLGDVLSRGQKFGIICYGSRVECWVPRDLFIPTIKKGQKVKAGLTVLGHWNA